MVGLATRGASAHRRPRPSRAGTFLLWVVGANPAYIDDVSERRWYHSMGLAVLMVAIFAFIGAATTLAFRFDDPRVWIVGGLVWAVAVFIVDRSITSYVERYPTFWRKLVTVVPRVALALLAAVAVSEALVLNLLSNEIEQQLVIANARSATERRDVATVTERPELDRIAANVDRLTTDRNNRTSEYAQAQLRVTCETAGGRSPGCAGVASTSEVGRGPLVRDVLEPAARAAKVAADKAQLAYDAYLVDLDPSELTDAQLTACGYVPGQLLTRVNQERCAVTARIEAAAAVPPEAIQNVVLNRVIAVFQIGEPGSSQRSASHLVHLVLFGLFLFFDLIPLIMKFSRGPTAHDEAFRAATLPTIPRFDDRRLKRSMWADHRIGKAVMEKAREVSAMFYEKLYQEQAQRRLAQDALAGAGVGPTIGLRSAGPIGPGGTATSSRPTSAATDSRQAGPNGTAIFSRPTSAATDPGIPTEDASRPQDNLEDASDPFDQQMLGPGAMLQGQFRLMKQLGQHGQYYAIYRVRDQSVNGGGPVDLVAKIALNGDEGEYGYKGLEREVEVGQGDEHPHIVPALSKVRRDERLGVAYRIMPFYPGGHLGKWIERHPARTLANMLDVGDGILAGLEEGHVGRRFRHWDIKPENVLMRDTGPRPHPVVGDWGNGKRHYQFNGQSTFELRATPDYCAPEQVIRKRDRRCYASDLYSWAAVMYYFVEETSPRRRAAERADIDPADPLEYREFILSDPTMPRLTGRTPPELAELIHRWLAFEPEDRFLPEGTRLTDDELRDRQVVSDVRRKLAEVRAGLSPEQLAMPVRSMGGGGNDAQAGRRTER
ncbi:MAG: DUF4407 domain-containing protein [Pseudonocardiaceae bacterium]